jgi:fluoride ion exporter CrcB/FEX
MAAGYNALLRNAQLDAITTFVGAGAKLRIYDGARPATGGATTNLLAEFTLGAPFAPAAAASSLSPTLPAAVNAGATGTATWFRVVKADGVTHCFDGAVGAEMTLNTASITAGLQVSITGWTINRGNP